MKRSNKYLIFSFVTVVMVGLFASCEEREDWRFPELGNGGFIKFVEQPYSWEGLANAGGTSIVKYHIGEDPATSSFNAAVEDPNGNVASYEVFVKGNFAGAPIDPIPYTSTTSFPFDVSFTTADMAALFGVDASTFEMGDYFDFTTITTTTDGRVYTSTKSGCDCPTVPNDPGSPGTWNEGTIDGIILQGGDTGTNEILPAIYWRVYYLAPSE